MSGDGRVLLECVREGARLRVKMRGNGYLIGANCQFPKDLRVAGRKQLVRPSAVHLVSTRGKWFQSIRNKREIEVVDGDVTAPLVDARELLENTTVQEDETSEECCICLENAKDTIIHPCGHFQTCAECASKLRTCPICRGPVGTLLKKSDMG